MNTLKTSNMIESVTISLNREEIEYSKARERNPQSYWTTEAQYPRSAGPQPCAATNFQQQISQLLRQPVR